MNNHDHIPADIEQVERFLRKEMPPEEREAFLDRLATDGELQQVVEEMQLLSIGIQEAALQRNLDQFHKEMPALRPAKRNVFSTRRVAAAAVIIVASALAFWLLLNGGREEKLFTSYYQPDPGLPTLMSSADNYEFYQAMVDYKSGEYEKAIAAWDALLQQQPANDTLSYYLGSAWLANKQPAKAITYLEKVAANTNSSFVQDAGWYLALAWLQQGDKEKAKAALEKTQHRRREELLQELRR